MEECSGGSTLFCCRLGIGGWRAYVDLAFNLTKAAGRVRWSAFSGAFSLPAGSQQTENQFAFDPTTLNYSLECSVHMLAYVRMGQQVVLRNVARRVCTPRVLNTYTMSFTVKKRV